MLIEAPLHNRNKEQILGLLKKDPQDYKNQLQRPQLELCPTHKFDFDSAKRFEQQYSSICYNRYYQQKGQFRETIKKHNFNVVDMIQKINTKESYYVIGTLYKQMNLKPSILNPNSQELSSYISDDDKLELEDTSGRIRICLHPKVTLEGLFSNKRTINIENLVTGLVVLVEGKLIQTNLLQVSRIFYPDPDDLVQNIRTQEVTTQLHNISLSQEQPQYIAIVSGLNFDINKSQQQITQMINFFQGKLTTGFLQKVVHQTVGIIIAGNLVKKDDQADEILTGPMKKTEGFKTLYSNTEAEFKELDHFLYNLSLVTPIYIMPGENDPVSILLPQQPFYKVFFPQCFEQGSNVKLLTNPMDAQIGNINILGTSGQNINDMSKYCSPSKEESRIELLEQNILFNNIAPTAPDTLQCYPYIKTDPFILQKWPHIYFSGNQPKFQTELIQQYTRILTVPSYSDKKEICFVSLSNLDCFSITIE